MSKKQPRHPIYIPSKGRAGKVETVRLFESEGVPYRIVVEPQEYKATCENVSKEKVVVLPKNNQGLVYARNFCKQHSIEELGAERHWQVDDDIKTMGRICDGYRLRCDSNICITAAEDFIDRYENVGLCAFNHIGFIPMNGTTRVQWPPFHLNFRCYTFFCMMNSLPLNWRFKYNEDTDMTLQVLSYDRGSYCTMMFNHFFMQTGPTNNGGATTTREGGQASVYADDGRLQMARQLERVWPHVVTTKRKFGRPQHKVAHNWTRFDNKLRRRKDLDWDAIEKSGKQDLGMKLTATQEVKSKDMKELFKKHS